MNEELKNANVSRPAAVHCPFCGSANVKADGTSPNGPLYRCVRCRGSFCPVERPAVEKAVADPPEEIERRA